VIALGFVPVGFAKSSAGEYTFTLFAVVVIAVLTSWVVAAIFTPLIGTMLLKPHKHKDKGKGHHEGGGLYGEFINECSKLAIDSLAHGIEEPEKMWSAYALLNRIRLSASGPVLAEAEAVLKRIAEQYFAPNISLEEFRKIALSREADPLRSFGEACRTELKALRATG
jgi:hypothetical protein